MKDGEYVTFRRRRQHKNCNMKDLYFTVLKVRASESFIFYAVAGDFEDAKFDEIDDDPYTNYRYNHQIAFIKCFHGWIDDLRVFDESLGDEEPTVDARRCGIGTVLSELCLIDPEIYDPKPSDRAIQPNMALDELKNKYHATNEFEMVTKNCVKLVGLKMAARIEDPEQRRAGGHAYLTAAINMRYEMLLVEAGRITGSETTYSDQNRNALNVYHPETAKENYDSRTGIIKPCCGRDMCVGYQSNWFFCGRKRNNRKRKL